MRKVIMQKKNIVISACLLGKNCRYDGKSKEYARIEELKEKYNLFPVCPEVMGGLPTPRVASENIGDKVFNQDGIDNTTFFNKGASKALEVYYNNKCEFAILKESSPSCGSNKIYDGTFSGKKIPGMGVTAKLFKENGIKIYTEEDIDYLLKEDRNA